jgi:putative ABC transport system permease protein
MRSFRIAFRNMTRQKRRSLLLGGAIAIGVMIITLLDGFTGGLSVNLRKNLSSASAGHIFITGTVTRESGRNLDVIRDDAVLTSAIKEAGVQYAFLTRRSSIQGTLIFGSTQVNQRIDGVSWDGESYFKDRLVLLEGSLSGITNPKSLILPSATAKLLHAQVGDTVLCRLTTVSGQQNVDEFIVTGISADIGGLGQASAYADIRYVNQLLNLAPGEYQSLNVYLSNMDTMDGAGTALYDALARKVRMAPRAGTESQGPLGGMASMAAMHGGGGGPMAAIAALLGPVERLPPGTVQYTLTTLNELMGPFLTIITVLNMVGFGVFLVLLAITMVGVLNTFRMVMLERTREIGTMRAMGMHRGSVRNLFLWEALCIAVGAAAAGLAAAGVVMGILSIPRFTNAALLMFLDRGRILFSLHAPQVVMNLVVLAVLSLLAAWIPARNAARIRPVDALRADH